MRWQWLLLATLLILFFLHDYIFNYIFLDTAFVYLAAWKDVVSFVFVAYICLLELSSKNVAGGRGSIVVLTTLFLMIGISALGYKELAQNGLSNFRFYFVNAFLFLFFAFIIAKWEERFQYFKKIVVSIGLVILIYGLYQYFTHKVPDDFWYWSVFNARDLEQQEWNVFRDGKPRISSVYTSSLDFSLYVYVYSMFILRLAVIARRDKRRVAFFNYSLLFLFCSVMVYLATVRASQIALISSLILIVGFSKISAYSTRVLFSFFSFVFLTGATFAYIAFGYTDDLSVLGRLPQWIEFFDVIPANFIAGVGIGDVGPNGNYWFDSFWINVFFSFGAIVGVWVFLLMWKINFTILKRIELFNRDPVLSEYYYIYLCIPIIMYLFFFQSFSRTPALLLIFVPLLVFERRRKMMRRSDLVL